MLHLHISTLLSKCVAECQGCGLPLKNRITHLPKLTRDRTIVQVLLWKGCWLYVLWGARPVYKVLLLDEKTGGAASELLLAGYMQALCHTLQAQQLVYNYVLSLPCACISSLMCACLCNMLPMYFPPFALLFLLFLLEGRQGNVDWCAFRTGSLPWPSSELYLQLTDCVPVIPPSFWEHWKLCLKVFLPPLLYSKAAAPWYMTSQRYGSVWEPRGYKIKS